jgi:hypothetical protein
MSDWTPSFPDLPVLDDLGAQLAAAAAEDEAPRRIPRRRRWTPPRRLRLTLIVLATAVVLAAAAFAATQLIEVGPKVSRYRGPGAGGPLNHTLPGTSRVLPLRVADPDGGPAWGIRVFRIPHHMTCIQIARVLHGRLGVLGRDGAFGDDGRFHELPAQGALAPTCGHLDGAGHLFLDDAAGPTVASGDDGYLTGSQAGRGPVPRGDRRTVVWGFAGPKATRITLTGPGVHRSLRPRAADEWAYLSVLRGRHHGLRHAITYVGGRTCVSGRGVRVDEGCLSPPGLVTP